MIKLPKSVRKYIRGEKTRIRREILDTKKQEKLIQEIYQRFSSPNHNLKKIRSDDQKKR